ncbi:MAG: Gfo/Idh/MocA family oxidoreductase, partial [Dehalococcoidia bacterium]
MKSDVKDTLGIGLIGAGSIGSERAECFQCLPGVEIRAIADSDQDRLNCFANDYDVPGCHVDWHELISRDDVSVVHIATPNYLHAEMAIAAAGAGKHVICEKPLCLTLEEADLMIDTCHRQGVKLCYAQHLCFAPKYVLAKQAADAGHIGGIYSVTVIEKCGGPNTTSIGTWDKVQAGGGALIDTACHAIEVCRWVMDKQPVR